MILTWQKLDEILLKFGECNPRRRGKSLQNTQGIDTCEQVVQSGDNKGKTVYYRSDKQKKRDTLEKTRRKKAREKLRRMVAAGKKTKEKMRQEREEFKNKPKEARSEPVYKKISHSELRKQEKPKSDAEHLEITYKGKTYRQLKPRSHTPKSINDISVGRWEFFSKGKWYKVRNYQILRTMDDLAEEIDKKGNNKKQEIVDNRGVINPEAAVNAISKAVDRDKEAHNNMLEQARQMTGGKSPDVILHDLRDMRWNLRNMQTADIWHQALVAISAANLTDISEYRKDLTSIAGDMIKSEFIRRPEALSILKREIKTGFDSSSFVGGAMQTLGFMAGMQDPASMKYLLSLSRSKKDPMIKSEAKRIMKRMGLSPSKITKNIIRG